MADEQNKDEKDPTATPSAEPPPAEAAESAEPVPAVEAAAPAVPAEPVAERAAEDDDASEAPDSARAPGPSEPDKASASPAAILARVQALGEEDESERVSREEEEKLAERRAAAKRKSKLESAASKKLDQIGTKPKKKKRPVVEATDDEPAAAKPYNDALYRRTMTLGEWIVKNKRQVGTVVAALAVAGLGAFAYVSYNAKQNADASRILLAATADENGRIGGPAKKDDDAPPDPRPEFATVEARNASALGKYREVSGKYKGTGAAILARLAEGSLLLDGKDADGALAAYGDASKSPLAAVDTEVHGRALEGMGFAYEMKGNLDEAMKTYKELENVVEVKGFKELAIYHQARVAEAKGDKDKAKELYKTVHTRITDPLAKNPFPYLQEAVEDRLRSLDPSALPEKQSPFGVGGGSTGGSKINEAQMKKLQEQIKKQMEEAQKKQQEQQEKGGAAPGGGGQ